MIQIKEICESPNLFLNKLFRLGRNFVFLLGVKQVNNSNIFEFLFLFKNEIKTIKWNKNWTLSHCFYSLDLEEKK